MARKIFTDESLQTFVDEIKSYTDEAVSGQKPIRTTRFTVGTSASGWTSSDCDYLCDGTADQTEINAAITALPSTGGEVVLLDGIYNIAGEIKLNKANVILRGNGASTKIQVPTSYNTNYLVINVTGDYCTVRDLYINPTNISSTAICISLGSNVDNCIIENNSCVGATTGIALNSGKYNRISNNFIQAVRRVNTYGIDLRSGSNNDTIIGNTCIGNGCGIAISGSTSVAISEHTIVDNICSDGDEGLSLNFANNCTITGNTCNDNYSAGIYFRGNNNTVSGNTCYSNVYGIQTGSTSNSNTITGNTARDNSSVNMRLAGLNYSVVSSNNLAVLSTDTYPDNTEPLELYSTTNNYNIITDNHLGIKNYTNEGGTGNSFVNNYYNGAATTRSNSYTVDEGGNAWFAGNLYVGGTSQDDGTAVASVSTLTQAEYTALEQAQAINANTLYMLTDAEDEGSSGGYIDDEVLITVDDIDAICGATISYINLNEGAF